MKSIFILKHKVIELKWRFTLCLFPCSAFSQDTITFPNQPIWEIRSSKLAERGQPFLIALKDSVMHHAGQHIEIIVVEETKANYSSCNAAPRSQSLVNWLQENNSVDPPHLKATGICKLVEEYSGEKFAFPYKVLMVIDDPK